MFDKLGGAVADPVNLSEGEEDAEADAERAHDGGKRKAARMRGAAIQ
jgi:hypothetical protein